MNGPATDVLDWSRELVTPALRDAIDSLPASMRRIAGYHFGWWDADGQPANAAGGKALRPALVLLAAQAVGSAPGPAVPAAVAVELVHNFSLLHDDVMDGDATRRHRPTVWRMFGVNAAILAGDALLTLAFDVLAASGHPAVRDTMQALSAAVQELVAGQASDVAFERRTDVTVAECVRMASGKTGALLGKACALGAAFGKGTPEQITHLRLFGERLGLAFQVVDDLLGIWGDPQVTGKPVYSDLSSRKKSLPVVAALNSDTPEATELAALYYREGTLSTVDLEHAAELIERSGARAWCQATADELFEEALRHLATAEPSTTAADDLTSLARLATRRNY